jgi:hypothetical protein
MLLCHLLACHSTLICIVKVRFPDQSQVQFGVVASQDLAEGSCIVELCGVLSSDIVDGEHFSLMEAHPTQLLRKGPRLMTGPARFVNHFCNPNVSVSINPGGRNVEAHPFCSAISSAGVIYCHNLSVETCGCK